MIECTNVIHYFFLFTSNIVVISFFIKNSMLVNFFCRLATSIKFSFPIHQDSFFVQSTNHSSIYWDGLDNSQ